jgi:hypothetical protein
VKQEVNVWDVFNLSLDDLKTKLQLNRSQTQALIFDLDIQSDPALYRVLKRKSHVINGYSKKALDLLREALPKADLAQVWKRYKARKHPLQ